MNVQNIVTAAEAARDRSAETARCDARDWTSADAHRRYVRALETLSFWADSPKSVIASATGNHCWGYAASEVLDAASFDAYPDADINAAYIETIDRNTYRLVIR